MATRKWPYISCCPNVIQSLNGLTYRLLQQQRPKKGKKLGGDEIQKFNFRKIKNHMIGLFRSMHIQGSTRKSILGEKKE